MAIRSVLVAAALIGLCSRSFGQAPSSDRGAAEALGKRIDAHLARAWKEHKVQPAPLADDYVFFRRLSLDLRGKIPTLTEIHDFVDDPSPNKRAAWVDRFLDDERHVTHYSRFWRSTIVGESANIFFGNALPDYERWMANNLKKGVPLDQVAQQTLSARVFNNTLGIGGRPEVGMGSPAAFYTVNENKAENLAASASRVFLGVKLECAQCHKHPFAKWTREQFWEFAAFFSAVRVNRGKQDVGAVSFSPGKEIQIPETKTVVKAKFLNGQAPNWEGASSGTQVLAEWVTSKDNPYFAKAMADHLWSHFFGMSLLEPIIEPADDGQTTHPEMLDDIAKAFREHNYDPKFLIRAFVSTQAYQRTSGGSKPSEPDEYHLYLRMPIRSLTGHQLFDNLVEATEYDERTGPRSRENMFGQALNISEARSKFLAKFTNQDRKYDPQTTILQALLMMNGDFVSNRVKIAINGSLQTLANQGTPMDKKVQSLYLWVLCRPPRAEELQRAVRYLESGGPSRERSRAFEDLYWALLNSPDFLLNY